VVRVNEELRSREGGWEARQNRREKRWEMRKGEWDQARSDRGRYEGVMYRWEQGMAGRRRERILMG